MSRRTTAALVLVVVSAAVMVSAAVALWSPATTVTFLSVQVRATNPPPEQAEEQVMRVVQDETEPQVKRSGREPSISLQEFRRRQARVPKVFLLVILLAGLAGLLLAVTS